MSGGPITNEEGEVMGVLARGVVKGYLGSFVGHRQGPAGENWDEAEDITILGNRELPDARKGSQEFEFVLRDRWTRRHLFLWAQPQP